MSQGLKDAYEALGPAIKYRDAIPLPRAYQHTNLHPIHPHESKNMSGIDSY